MFELSKHEYYKVKFLIETGYNHPEIVSIIEQNNPGWIFIDDKLIPETALVWSKGIKGFYLIGNENNHDFLKDINENITTIIAPRMRGMGLDYFEASGNSGKWKLDDIFSSRVINRWGQFVYKYVDSKEKLIISEIDGYNFITLGKREFINEEFKRKELLQSHINLFWDSEEQFLSKGFGCIALEGDEIVGICYSSFITNETHAIGVETLTEHQRKGIGYQLAARVVNEIIENGYTAYWDCSMDNEGSIKLAEKLGFDKDHQYSCIGFPI
ncbi:GNAT family N-acetyltransferase [Paenibacillus sp. IHBB 10380]|uniref:GNAT family N-acetyltransferase n=1 Tax=Paenibacillus sp. IHBB 10380 TaxID=1566358 RepID=UPI0005CFC700|nr:GNAT family N-acetyltransferase [Paenibacillus sp. IHBB 10380]AJS59313.1 hypothetical protein UB51_13485 [Paenibacillus sp. IHBB 10380]